MTNEEILKQYKRVYDYVDRFGIFEVRALARAFGVKVPTNGRKRDLIMRLLAVACGEVPATPLARKCARVKAEAAADENVARIREMVAECGAANGYDFSDAPAQEMNVRDCSPQQKYGYGDELLSGVLECNAGSGYLRLHGHREGKNDPVVPESLIKKQQLRAGDTLTGYAESKGGVRLFVQTETVNGAAQGGSERPIFEELPAVYPSERIPFGGACAALRAADLLCPVGKGQRALVHVPGGADVSAYFAAVAEAAAEMRDLSVFLLSVGCGPEEEAELRARFPRAEAVCMPVGGNVLQDMRALRLALAHAKRVAEGGGDALILLDSMTALARAYGEAVAPTGRRAAGGTDRGVLAECMAFFASARKLQGAGSVTLLAAVNDGGAADEDVIAACAQAANAQIYLLPCAGEGVAVDPVRSRTRNGAALLGEEERARAEELRRGAAEEAACKGR